MTLLYSIESCLKQTQLPPSRFGREAVRDPRLVHDLRRGRQPGPAMERRVHQYIALLLAKSRQPDPEPAQRPASASPRFGDTSLTVEGR